MINEYYNINKCKYGIRSGNMHGPDSPRCSLSVSASSQESGNVGVGPEGTKKRVGPLYFLAKGPKWPLTFSS